jgi:transcriptional regulator with XRE-family HTH domain
MTQDEFRAVESAVSETHADMAERLGISEVSVKRYATGTQPIPEHIARLAVALLLMQREGLQKKFETLLDKYHGDTHN